MTKIKLEDFRKDRLTISELLSTNGGDGTSTCKASGSSCTGNDACNNEGDSCGPDIIEED